MFRKTNPKPRDLSLCSIIGRILDYVLGLTRIIGLAMMVGITPSLANSTINDTTIIVIDDTGQKVQLDSPAKRIISLSPGLTELLFSAGAGAQIKGVVSYSDFPAAAKQIPRVGSYNSLDMERIIALNPDIIFAWQSGNPESQIEQLKKLGLTVYLSEPHQIQDIEKTLIRMGRLTGHLDTASQRAEQFIQRLERFIQQNEKKPRVTVFAQIWNKPVMSVGGNHLISALIQLCGGNNIFQAHDALTITPNIESVLEKQPQVILSTGMAKRGYLWLQRWQQWENIPAVKQQQLYSINPDLLVRHTVRVLEGAETLCQYFDQAREQYSLNLN